MSILTVRTPGGQNLNICDSEWSVRNDENTGWIRIDPQNDVRVRHGSNEYWLPVTCDGDNELCPPESIMNCWPGYSGIFDSAEFKTGGPTGYLVCNCDGSGCKTYTGHTPTFDVIGGRFFSTSPVIEGGSAQLLPTTLYGSNAEVTEMLVKAGNRSGAIDVSILALDPGVRVRIYHDCDMLGDSSINGDYFNVFFNAEPPELREEDCGVMREVNNFITVRVDAPAGARWRIRLGEVNVIETTSFQRPAPCFGTFAPHLPCFIDTETDRVIPGVATYEMIHQIPNNGRVHLDTTVVGPDPVRLSVYYNGGMLATLTTTNSAVNTNTINTIAFDFTNVGGDSFIVIRYEAPRSYNDWTYSIYCPGVRGSRSDMMPCTPVPSVIPYDVLCTPLLSAFPQEWTVSGKGAPYNDIYYDFSGKSSGDIVVEFFASNPVQMLFYQGSYPNEVLVGGTVNFVQGHDRFYFDFDPSKGTVIHARVVGPCCPDWSFMISCPVPKPIINIYDAEIIRGSKGQTDLLCFTVDLQNKTPRDVTFDWAATPITAMESTDGTCTITEEVPDSPYCNIVGSYGVQYGAATNDMNIGYPQARRISSTAHSVNCAQGGQYYVMECDFEFPYDGEYTFVGTADDNLFLYINCELAATASGWNQNFSNKFSTRGGWGTISIMYQNVPNCTPGWAKMVILDNAGNVIFATNESAYAWRSKVGGITIDPPPLAITYGADYNKSSGQGVIPACTLSTQICVPVCGTDLMGPDVTFQITLSNVQKAVIGDLVAIGTIKNPNYFVCDQNTQIAVLDGGDDQYVNRGARKMFINKMSSNGGAAYVMDATINLPQSGLFTFYFFGLDVAEFYVDCNLVARVDGNGGSAVKVRLPMNVGDRKMYINYYMNNTPSKRTGYAALAIVDPLNRVVYASHAEDWRGRIVNAGTPPSCNQFPNTCNITPQGTALAVAGYGNAGVGYGAVAIQSDLHAVGCAPANTFFTLELQMNFPVSGAYTFRGIADDTLDIYIDCKLVLTGTLNAIAQAQANVSAGSHLVTFAYKNVPKCTPGYAIFAILNPDGSTFYASNANGWVSAQGSLLNQPVAMHETYYQGRYVQHISTSIGSGGTNYAWWSAELDWVCPADGNYYVIGGADDNLEVFIGCVNRSVFGGQFLLDAGAQKMHVRCYNLKSKNPNYFYFTVYNAAGQAVYTSRADGWKCKWADLDFTGLS